MTNREQLLDQYARTGSETVFQELVANYLDLVYSTTLRLVDGDGHRAKDVAQVVFADLARLAATLPTEVSLGGWLHRHTCFMAANMMRSERRRAARERQAVEMNALRDNSHDFSLVAPVLDEAINELREEDRQVILLRFFEQHDFRSVGEAIGSGEDAARMRVNRALKQLERLLKRRGVTTTAAALSAALVANAVQAAPSGLATLISTAAVLTKTATATSTVITATKTITMTILQKTLVTAAVAILAGAGIYQSQQAARLSKQNQALRQQQADLLAQNAKLSSERDEAAARMKSLKSLPHLPAPPMTAVATPVSAAAVNSTSNNLIRLLNGEVLPNLTPEQIAAYLKENHHNAASLLAVYRATGDKTFLSEAVQSFPGDPQVAFEAVFNSSSPEERRQSLDNFERAAPDNALASYLSALDYFNSGATDQAVKELAAASGKSQFNDYSWDFVQNSEEALRSAGFTEAEIKMAGTWQLPLPQVPELNQLSQDITALASAYQQAGDPTSAQAALMYDMHLGQQLDGSANDLLINQLNGMAIQRAALAAMDPTAASGTPGQTAADQIALLSQQDAAIKGLVQQMSSLQSTMSAQDWITYNDRTMAFGELNALQWLVGKYPHP